MPRRRAELAADIGDHRVEEGRPALEHAQHVERHHLPGALPRSRLTGTFRDSCRASGASST